MHIKRTPALAYSLALAALALTAFAGPLNPPAGAVAPTAKPLSEVEPRIAVNATNTPGDADSLFKITQPGSYYLTGNITGVVGKHGIEIAASGVTLDLNGFDLAGVTGMGAFDGVSVVNGGVGNVTVRNGSVRNWGDEGVDLSITLISRIDGVLATDNLGNGIHGGSGGMVSNCTAYSNSGDGIANGSSCVVSNCAVFDNSGVGIRALIGISSITGCLASGNAGGGISAGSSCTIAGCTVKGNSLDGILCVSACLIVGNLCAENGSGASVGAGIHATGTDNRIEGNNCTGADRGIDVDLAGNIIIRNTCSGNTNNWDVVAGNVILVINAATAGAVTGNSGGTAPGSTDPNANFTY